MNDSIPIRIVREIISDILIERSNVIMQDCEEIIQKEISATVVCSDWALGVGTESCGTRVLADEILYGQISIEEAVREILTQEERKEAKARCQKWLEERRSIDER